jgi:hypothetical protein
MFFSINFIFSESICNECYLVIMSACGQGFEQKSRLARHMHTSHPPSAPSAANLENALRYTISKDKRRVDGICITKTFYGW